MKIIRTLVVAVLFVASVFFATANMHSVQLVVPELPGAGWPSSPPFELPLFVLVLITLLLGLIVGGLGTLFEQIRLRASARRARKDRDRAIASQQAAEDECERIRGDLERVQAELATALADLERSARVATESGPVATESHVAFGVDPDPDDDEETR